MSARKGYTLIEIVVTMIIMGLVAAFAIPNMMNSIEQTKAQSAINNLLAIAAAQQKYYEDGITNPASYCTSSAPNATCANTTANLCNNLHLSFAGNDPFTYTCASTGSAIPYNCTATDGTDTLVYDPNVITASCSGAITCAGTYCPC